nr:hypothetical protein [Tanacetum cinerariifolium]
SEEAPTLLARKTESLTPVASLEHEGFSDFYELQGFQEQHADPQVLLEQEELTAVDLEKYDVFAPVTTDDDNRVVAMDVDGSCG